MLLYHYYIYVSDNTLFGSRVRYMNLKDAIKLKNEEIKYTYMENSEIYLK